MTQSSKNQAPEELYRECFVAFLDILGFRSLVEQAAGNVELLGQLAGITASTGQLSSGAKQTSLGPCLMQTRAFSDCIVVFTPTQPTPGEFTHPNPLAQLLFVVRFLHDRVLELGACVRGAVALGPMYWHKTWSDPSTPPPLTSRGSMPLTFGKGVVDAYRLESEVAKVPRVVMSGPTFEHAREKQLPAYPLAREGCGEPLTTYVRHDRDAVAFVDLLHPNVTRNRDEKLVKVEDGFTVEWTPFNSSHGRVVEQCNRLIDQQLAGATDAGVRAKYEWLRLYVDGFRDRP